MVWRFHVLKRCGQAASGHRGVSRSPAVRRVERPSQGHRLSDVRLSLVGLTLGGKLDVLVECLCRRSQSKAQAKADRSSDVAGRSLHHVPSPAGGKEVLLSFLSLDGPAL